MLELVDPPARQTMARARLVFPTQQTAERVERQRDAGNSVRAAPGEGLAEQELGKAVGCLRPPPHSAQRQSSRARDRHKVQEAGQSAASVLGQRKESVFELLGTQVVGRHGEALHRHVRPVGGRDLVDRLPLRFAECAGLRHPHPVARSAETVYRLPHLADRSALKREALGDDHGLVADVDRAQPDACPGRTHVGGHTDDRDAPRLGAAQGGELLEQAVKGRTIAYRVA